MDYTIPFIIGAFYDKNQQNRSYFHLLDIYKTI